MKRKCNIWIFPFFVFLCFYIFNNSCKKESPPGLAIGDTLKGGIVAYILLPGDRGYDAGLPHGIIAAPYDHGSLVQWSINNSATGAKETALGSGFTNTLKIVADQGEGNYAAKVCYDLVLGGYSNWYLPSKDELIILNRNRNKIPGFYLFNANTNYYWSSSELDSPTNSYSWFQGFFYTENPILFLKLSIGRVRCIRSF
jgi:hypothetical protein